MLNEITLENFRCFREQQTARLAPLTLLVGENSAGKTSFLALIQVLLDITHNPFAIGLPNFKKSPYDLGTFDEIAHHRGGRGGRADRFKAGFGIYEVDPAGRTQHSKNSALRIDIEFGRGSSTVPVPISWDFSSQDTYIHWNLENFEKSLVPQFRFGTSTGSWKVTLNSDEHNLPSFLDARMSLLHSSFIIDNLRSKTDKPTSKNLIEAINGGRQPTKADWEKLHDLAFAFSPFRFHSENQVFSSAPVRSKPHRTYDPADVSRNPEGDYIPMYMANKYFENKNDWKKLQASLVQFGKNSGLFDEISVKSLGKKSSEPFQLQIRKYGSKAKGPSRNLIDVGYGVSQVLPIVTELCQERASAMYLMQQPEVHLHPSAKDSHSGQISWRQ